MKNKLFIIMIILVLSIIYCQYKIFNINKKNNVIANNNFEEINIQNNIKGINIHNYDLNFPITKDLELVKIPQKKEFFTEPKIEAKNYILIDKKSKFILIQKDAYNHVPIASTTKIMTAIIALDNYNLNDIIEVSETASSQIGSEVYLQKGEKISVKNLLSALLINSGNDAAMALAEHFNPGGEKEFVKKMNEKAQFIGAENTFFKDPTGLDDSAYSTAYDLSIITAYALNNYPEFAKIIKTVNTEILSEDKRISHKLETSNRLINPDEPLYYQFAIGVKTGYTPNAGHCLVSAANKDENILIAVVLNTFKNSKDASAEESKKLLEWGYNNYSF